MSAKTKILSVIAACAALALPAIAIAQKFPTSVTANLSDNQSRIYGVVQSGDYACEKARDVRLYGPDFDFGKRRGGGFDRYDEVRTNRFGEYRFDFFGKVVEGEYFVRALRKDFPGNACRRADSNSVFVDFGD